MRLYWLFIKAGFEIVQWQTSNETNYKIYRVIFSNLVENYVQKIMDCVKIEHDSFLIEIDKYPLISIIVEL